MLQAIYDNLDPVAFSVGSISVHWYGLSYIVAVFFMLFFVIFMNRKRHVFKNTDQIYDAAIWLFLGGAILGGRLGYVLFYNFSYFVQNPSKIFALSDGGMSIHGGIISIFIVGYFWAKKHKVNLLDGADIIAPAAAFTQAGLGRLGNFINGELVGRPILNESWNFIGVNFGDGILRYPSQLFQALTGFLLFAILTALYIKHPKTGVVFFTYLILHGLFRFIVEFWREPDSQLGFIFGSLTMGQLLSTVLMIAGAIGLFYIRKK